MKNTQEFFQLGVTKPAKSDVQNYLNGLGTRLMQQSDIKKKIINHFKNIKNLQLDPAGRKILSFEGVEMKEQGSEWEEMFGDVTYQDSYWGDPDTITGKIKKAREKAEAKAKDDDEELDHKVHQQRTKGVGTPPKEFQ